MIRTIEVSGKTEDEAVEFALEQLNLSRDDISVEIVERAKTGFLGIKNTPAIVKIQYEYNENRAAIVENFLKGLFKRMDVAVNTSVTESDDTINVELTGSEPGVLIGRRGETLDAIQHLTNYVINRGTTPRIRVNLDAENYRKRRNDTLETLAAKTAEKVIRYRKSLTLDPMNAYERHIIHATLQENANISTYSIGTEPNRRVVVSYGQSGTKGRYSHSERQPQKPGYTEVSKKTKSDITKVKTDNQQTSNNEKPTYREWS